MIKNYQEYAQPTGIIRMLEKKLLTDVDFKRMMSLDAQEARWLVKANYMPELDTTSIGAAVKSLEAELPRIYTLMYELSPDAIIVDIPRQVYVYHNARVVKKAAITGGNADNLLIMGEYGDNSLELPDITDPQKLDIEIDRQRLTKQLEMAESTGVEYIIEYYKLCIDFYNLKAFFRARAVKRPTLDMLIDGGHVDVALYRELWDKPTNAVKEKLYYKYYGKWAAEGIDKTESAARMAAFEAVFDGVLSEHIAKARYVGFGPEVIFAFIIAKENELKQFRRIIGKRA